ncbi:MAG: aspartate aminotransferase family protein [Polyangiaceae bacterium]|nr:aspartate aminotransferase family protein [Polyangiaceae bacterium]MCE7888752.1 aspartate aminotransferase family protein [Sorangiineae bacterium PRO1]
MTTSFPETGKGRDEVLAALTQARAEDLRSDGRAFAFVYDPGEHAREVARDAFAACMPINGLDPTVYPSARKLENAVVKACLELMHAPEGARGTATAGGTESVMLAVKTARDFARKTRPEVRSPKMLLPVTAHACFHKAAHYLGVEVVSVDVDPVTFRADVADAARKMSADVILVVGSAPSYAHGVIDDIRGLAALALEHGTLMHVDACVGGCVLPFLRDTGVSGPDFDFSVEGVTSISMDLHKYGFAPKGISILLQRRRELRDAQYYTCATWTGYSIINSTTLGSKSVAALGAAYALIQHLGKEGYRERATRMWDATKQLVALVDATDGLEMVGRPDMNLFAFKTTGGDLFTLADRLTAKGWHVQPTYQFGPSPAHIHLTLDPENARRAQELGRDLVECCKDLPPSAEAPEGVVAFLSSLANGAEGVDTHAIVEEMGLGSGTMPSESAPLHRIMNAMTPDAREKLLVLFFAELFS